MKRILLLTFAVSLALAPAASARVVELGATATAAAPSCPESTETNPCAALVRTTALQGRAAGGPKNPYYIRRDGYIVAFTVTLSKPTQEQIDYFMLHFGEPAQVRLSVLRRGDTRKTRLNYRLVGQTENFRVDRYFGSSPTFVLQEPLRVKKTNWLALTVPTWAPMFANTSSGSDWWRSSRAKDSCKPPNSFDQFAMSALHDINVFGCTYHKARVLYTATYVPDPRETVKESK